MPVTKRGLKIQNAQLKAQNQAYKKSLHGGVPLVKKPRFAKAKFAAANIALGVAGNAAYDHLKSKSDPKPSRKTNYPTTRTYQFSDN